MVKFITLKHELMDDAIFEVEQDQAELEQAPLIPTPAMPTPVPTTVPDSIFQKEAQVELESAVEPVVAVGAGAGDSTTDSNCEQIIDSIKNIKGYKPCNATNGQAYCTIIPGCTETILSKCDYDCNTAPPPAPPTPGPGPTGGLPCGDIDNTNIVWTGLDPISDCNVNQCKDKDCNDCNNSFSTTTGHPCWGTGTVGETCKTHEDKYEREWLSTQCFSSPTPGPAPTGPGPAPSPDPTPPTPAPPPSPSGGTGKDYVCNITYDNSVISIYHHTGDGGPGSNEACSYYAKMNDDCDNNYIFIQAWWILQLLSQSTNSRKADTYQEPDIGGQKFKLFRSNFTEAAQGILQDYYVGRETFADDQFNNWPSIKDNPYLILNCTSGLNPNGCEDDGTDQYIKRYVNNMMLEDASLPEKNGNLYVVNDQFMQNFFLKRDNVKSCKWNNVPPGPKTPTPGPEPTPVPSPSPGSCPGDCGQTMCNSIKNIAPNLKQFTNMKEFYNSIKNPQEKSSINDLLKCDKSSGCTEDQLNNYNYCINVQDCNAECKTKINFKNCACSLGFNGDKPNESVFKLAPDFFSGSAGPAYSRDKSLVNYSKAISTDANKSENINIINQAFKKEDYDKISKDLKNCFTDKDGKNSCSMCGVQYFLNTDTDTQEQSESFGKGSQQIQQIKSDIVEGNIKDCCPGFKKMQQCKEHLDKIFGMNVDPPIDCGDTQTICVSDNTVNKYFTIVNYNGKGDATPKPPKPTPPVTNPGQSFRVVKTWETDTCTKADASGNLPMQVKKLGVGAAEEDIDFTKLGPDKSTRKCCLQKIQRISGTKQQYIVGRQIKNNICQNALACATNYIDPVTKKINAIAPQNDGTNTVLDNNSLSDINNLIQNDPAVCCSNFQFYAFSPTGSTKFKDVNTAQKYRTFIKNSKNFLKQVGISGADGLCLYSPEYNPSLTIDQLEKNYDQSTWDTQKTPGQQCDRPCIISLAQQVLQKHLTNSFNYGIESYDNWKLKTTSMQNMLKEIDTIIQSAQNDAQACIGNCLTYYCSDSVASIDLILKEPKITNKRYNLNNIFNIHKNKNISKRIIVDDNPTVGSRSSYQQVNMDDYLVFATSSPNNFSQVDKTKLTYGNIQKILQDLMKMQEYKFISTAGFPYTELFNSISQQDSTQNVDNTIFSYNIYIKKGKTCKQNANTRPANEKDINPCAKDSYIQDFKINESQIGATNKCKSYSDITNDVPDDDANTYCTKYSIQQKNKSFYDTPAGSALRDKNKSACLEIAEVCTWTKHAAGQNLKYDCNAN